MSLINKLGIRSGKQFFAGTLLSVCLALPTVSLAEGDDIQALVDELQALADKSRKERAADRWLQSALEDIVAKYNFPWRNSLFSDDFSDGNFNSDPAWKVSSGEFWIDRRLGLRSQVTEREVRRPEPEKQPERQKQQEDLGKALLGAFLQEALGPKKSQEQSEPQRQSRQTETVPASIRTALTIPTTFAVESLFSQNNRPGEAGQFEWIVMQDEQASNAYRVQVSTGAKGLLDVIRTRSGRDSYVDSVEVPGLNDGGEHALSWRQSANGDIEVYLDGVSVLKTNDKAFRYGFKYLGLINRSGDFSVSGVEVLGGS